MTEVALLEVLRALDFARRYYALTTGRAERFERAAFVTRMQERWPDARFLKRETVFVRAVRPAPGRVVEARAALLYGELELCSLAVTIDERRVLGATFHGLAHDLVEPKREPKYPKVPPERLDEALGFADEVLAALALEVSR